MQRSYLFVLKFSLSVSLIAVLVYWLDWQQVVESMKQANPVLMICAGLLIVLVGLLDGLRFYWMVSVLNMRLIEHLRLALQSAFVMQLGFGFVSGDVYRTSVYALRSKTVLQPMAHIIAARIAGLSSLGIVAFAISIWILISNDGAMHTLGTTIIKIIMASSMLVLLVFCGLFIAVRKRIISLPAWVVSAVDAFNTLTLRIWLISLIIVLIRGLGFACVLYSIGTSVHVHIPILASMTATLSSLLPFAFGGLGIRESAFAGTVALFGIPLATTMSAAIIMRVVVVIASAFGLLFSLALPAE